MRPTAQSADSTREKKMTTTDQTWAVRAACADVDPDQLFGKGAEQRDIRPVCFSCPVRMECLAEALDSDSSFGVWGGLTERERRALLRRFPEVTDWSEWLRQEDDDLVAEIHARRVPRILARVR
jgi:transcription factor whiB